jgi:hypothetical protein
MLLIIQDLSDWTKIISKANSLVQADRISKSKLSNKGVSPPTLLEDQKIGRKLYMFAEMNQRKSHVYQIYANVGLACLAIRRLLQVGHLSLPYIILPLIHALGKAG